MKIADAEFEHGIQWGETRELGTSNGFLSVPPRTGKGPSRRLQSNQTDMTGIEFMPTDRPVFAARGTRWSLIEMMGIQGHAERFDFPKTDERHWGADNQHSVLEISDVTAGTELPASDNGMRDMWAGRFGQLLLNGEDHENNGDFTYVRDISCEDMKYVVRSLTGQARSMHMLRIIAANIWTVFSNVDHENGTHGQFGGHVDSLSVGGFIGRLFEFTGTSVLGPLVITALKAEKIHRIGDWVGNSGNEGSFSVNRGNINFGHRKGFDPHGMPANVMGGNCQAAQIFDRVDFLGTNVLSMMPGDVRLRNASRFDSEINITEPWQKAAWNASLGVYCGSTQHDLKATLYADTDVHNVSTGDYRHGHIALPYWVERAKFPGTSIEIHHSRPKFARPKSEFTTTVDGLDVTLELKAGVGIPTPRAVGFYQGGAVRCDVTGQILWIKGVIGRKVYCEAMSGHDFTTAEVSTAGSWEFIAGGYKTPKAPLWGKFTPGSAVIGIEGSTEGLKAGDLLSVHQYGRGDFGIDPRIKEISGSTIELEEPVGVSGEFPLFVWIEDIEMQTGLGMGIQNTGSGSSLESDVATALSRTGGVWFDPSDAATVFQERSSPSTAAGNGNPVGTIQDKNGTNHGIPATDGQRATLTVSGGITYLDFDSASNNSYIFSNAITFGRASAVFLGIRRQASGTNLVRMMGDNGPGTFGMAWTTLLDAFLGGFGGGQRINEPLSGDTDWHVFGWTRQSVDSEAGEATLRVDGAEIDSLGHTETGATYTPILGGSGGTGAANNILADVTSMIVCEDLPTAAEIASIEAFITEKNGG